MRRTEPPGGAVRQKHREGGDQVVAAQGRILSVYDHAARHRPHGFAARPGEAGHGRLQRQYPRGEHPEPRRHLRRQRESLCEGCRELARGDGQIA